MAAESISQRVDAFDDPASQRSLNAILQSILIDIQALKTAHNTHQHSALNAVPSVALVGNLNTST